MDVSPHEGTICQHFQRAAELVGQRWVPQVIYVLLTAGTSRYTDIHDAIPGISDAMLSDRLKDLEAAKIITRDVEPSSPVRITYSLTDRGQELAAVLGELQVWAERWAKTPARSQR
jgi:DNA-binding HxlR family transcriptional regulator